MYFPIHFMLWPGGRTKIQKEVCTKKAKLPFDNNFEPRSKKSQNMS